MYALLLDSRLRLSYLELLHLPVDEVPRLQAHLRVLDRYERWRAVIEQHKAKHLEAVQARRGRRG